MVQLIRIAAALAAILVPAAAWALSDIDYTDPRSVVAAAYEPYLEPDFDWGNYDGSALYSRALHALFERDARESEAAGEVGRLDFDPLINAQDYDITNLEIRDPEINGSNASVQVVFENFGELTSVNLLLVKEDYGWSIDDVVTTDGELVFSLKELLEAPYP